MSYEEKQLSFLNKYFIFKKIKNVDTMSVTLDTTTSLVQEEDYDDTSDLLRVRSNIKSK